MRTRIIAVLRTSIVLGWSVFFHWFLLRTSGAWFIDGNSPSGNYHKSSRTQERISLELELKGKFKGNRSHQSKSGMLRVSKIKFQKSHSIPISDSITTTGTISTTATTTATATTNSSASTFVSTSPIIADPDSSQTNPIIYSPAPPYPVEALERHLEGRVLIKIETDGDGAVNSWGLEQSAGHEILDEAALSAVKEWRLAPRSAYLIPFTFRIK